MLAGSNSTEGYDTGASICVPVSSSLTISGDGSLTATCVGFVNPPGAGIGGSKGSANGPITITGGVINASSWSGAGIGGGGGSGGGNPEDNGGDGSVIKITGGIVTASSVDGAGIGGGGAHRGGPSIGGDGRDIEISGGTIHATSESGAGIGGSYARGGGKGNGVDIRITGGTIHATSEFGAGIGGGGSSHSENGGDGENIVISGGTVTAGSTGNGERKGAAIGGGGLSIAVTGIPGSGRGNRIAPAGGYVANAWHGADSAAAIQFLFNFTQTADISADTSVYMHIVFSPFVSDTGYTIEFITCTLTDKPTGVTVSDDGIADVSRLVVSEAGGLHAQGACDACDEIRKRNPLLILNISLTYGHSGPAEVYIPFSGGSGAYTILHCNNGVLEEQSALYANGGVTATWRKLSPFAVVRGAQVAVPENVVVDPPKTGTGSAVPYGALVLACVARMCNVYRKNGRNKS